MSPDDAASPAPRGAVPPDASVPIPSGSLDPGPIPSGSLDPGPIPSGSLDPGHTATTPSEPPPEESRRRLLRRWAVAAATVVVLVTGGAALSYTSLFAARTLEVEGERHLTENSILRSGGLDGQTNLVHLDRAATEARLESEPWIRDAVIDVQLPSTLRVVVRERSAVMVLPTPVRRLVAGDGTVLGFAPEGVVLPELHDAGGSTPSTPALRSAAAVVRAMAPTLRGRLTSILIDGGEVQLIVDREVEVAYGPARDGVAKAQAILAILRYADDAERGVLSIDVSAPAAPTARFVGSPTGVSDVPDPSADVPEDEATPIDEDDGDPST